MKKNFKTIVVASGKGGVGKSTVSVNAAVALAMNGTSVGLLDADVYGPNCHIMMGVNKLPPQTGEGIIPGEAHGVKVMSMGLLVDPNKPLAWRGPMLHSAIRQFVNDVDWGDLDYLVVDLPPGTGDAQLSISQEIAITGGFIVTLPQLISLSDARRGLELFKQLNVPVLGVVENMSYLITDEGKQLDVFGQGGGKSLSSDTGVDFIGSIPLDPDVRSGGDEGMPIVVSHPNSHSSKCFLDIASLMQKLTDIQWEKSQKNIVSIEIEE